VFADVHPEYGKMVEIDHGNGLVSRYAHASQLLVKEGDLVVAGQRVASVGTTGRSTGPHLHFEVRLNGVPQNPARFLKARTDVGVTRPWRREAAAVPRSARPLRFPEHRPAGSVPSGLAGPLRYSRGAGALAIARAGRKLTGSVRRSLPP
jgi:hypothetical protein